MKPSMQRQRGIGLIGGLILLLLVSFFLTIAFKLGPHYMEYLTVRSVMKETSSDPSLATSGRTSILDALERRLYINNVRGIGEKDFKVTKTKDGYLLNAEYQVQEHLFANIDAVMYFDHEVSINKQ